MHQFLRDVVMESLKKLKKELEELIQTEHKAAEAGNYTDEEGWIGESSAYEKITKILDKY